jgi:hypothetical protein
MARQPNKSNYLFLAGAGIAVILASLLILGLSKNGFSKTDFNKCAAFPVDSYLDGYALWSNTDYVISGVFQNILLQQQGSDCTLCSITTDEKKVTLPVIFTPSASKTPLHREQKIRVKVRVQDDGSIIASDCVIQ